MSENKEVFNKTICIDFDGVIHSYTSGWKGVDVIVDPPVDRAIAWLYDLIKNPEFNPVIYSSRSKDPKGIVAMRKWLINEFSLVFGDSDGLFIVEQLQFPTQKPPAWLTIDDRAIQFNGEFPSLDEMSNFIPWNKK